MIKVQGSRMGTRTLAGGCLSMLAVAGISLAAAFPAMAQTSYIPSTPEPGTDIPQASLSLGLKPYADNSFYVIAMEMGWFDDVGITIEPEGGVSLTEDNTNAMIINGNVDISGQFPPMSVTTYNTSESIKQIMFTDVIVSASIMAHPRLELKTFQDYIAEGMDFEEAIFAALEPTRQGQLAAPSPVVERVFEDAVTRLSGVEFDLTLMEDSQILVAARAGQIDFAHPGGAPIVYSLMQDGWVQLISLDDLLEHAPRDADSPLIPSIFIVGNVGNGDFINDNQTTVLRFMSAVWRTIDELANDSSLFDIQAPYLNSVAGTDLTGDDIAATVANFHPYTPFEDMAQYYEEDSLLYYKPIYEALIREYEENGILPAGVITPEEYIWGEPLWREMVAYKTQADELLAGLQGEELSPEQEELVAEATKHYGWHNYLDAYRLALAAAGT